MRLLSAALALAVACQGAACAPGVYASNGTKLGYAAAFAAVAAATQVAQAAAEQQARNRAPVTHASMGMNVSPGCDNDGQYGCLSVAPAGAAGAHPEPEMSDDEARDYVEGYLNGVRKLNGLGLLVRDDALDAFAQAGSDELAQDHLPNQHLATHAADLHLGEIQGPADGSSPGSLQDQLATVLLRFTGEGHGGLHHDAMLRPEWRKARRGHCS